MLLVSTVSIFAFPYAVLMRLLCNDLPRMRAEGAAGFVSLEQVLAEADIVTLHVPLSSDGPDRTLRLIDRNRIARMKTGAILLNSSRGEVVDSPALKEALGSGTLRVALDVWENEPEIDVALLNKVTLATPHIAGYSADGKANGTAMSVQAISRFFGLGLDTWYPASLPEPQRPILEIDGRNKTREEVLLDAIQATYTERELGYAAKFMDLYPVEAGDVLFVASNSGRNLSN